MSFDDGVLGSAVAQHPSAVNPRVLQHPIYLGASVSSQPMTSRCRLLYKQALEGDLKDVSRLVNEMICNGSMCQYMTGPPGTGVRVSESVVLSNHVVFTAIDTASLTDAVTITADGSVCHATAYLLFVSFIICLVIRRKFSSKVLPT